MTRKIATLGILALWLACAAPASADDLPSGTLEQLLGTWEWERAEGGFAGGIYYPADWGFTSQLVFHADGTVVEYRDETLYAQSTFLLVGDGPGATLDAVPSSPSVTPFGDCAPYLLVFGEEGGQTTMELRVQVCWDYYDFYFIARGPVADEPTNWSQVKRLFR